MEKHRNNMKLSSRSQMKKNFSLVFHFSILNIKMRYQSSYLGILWSAIEPLLYFIVLYVVFTSIRVRSDDFAIYLITGVLLFHIFVRGTSAGVGSLTSNAGLLNALKINKMFFPIVTTTATALLAFVDLGIFFGLMPPFNFVPTWTIFLIPIPIFLLFVLILGISYLLSILNVFARDVQVIWGIFSHTLIFFCPIFWKMDEVVDRGGGALVFIQQINPLGQIIELQHKLVINGEIPALEDWLYTSIFVLSIYLVGYFVFRKLQDKVVEEL